MFDKLQNPFIIRVPKKLGIEGMYLNIIEVICRKPLNSIIVDGETESLFYKSGMRKRYSLQFYSLQSMKFQLQ